MSLLEGLSMGRPVIAPQDVGIIPEFGVTEHICLYPAGNAEALERVVRACYRKKCECSQLVANRSWDDWAEAHHHQFAALLRARGHSAPTPAPGFRFGLLRRLNVPFDVDPEPLEALVDRANTHLFYGRHEEAQALLQEAIPRYECLQDLADSLETKHQSSVRREPATAPLHYGDSRVQTIPTTISDRLSPVTVGPHSHILVIAHVKTLRERMDKSHSYRYEALGRRAGVTIFGPGISGYRAGMSLDDAIKTACGETPPDVVLHGGDLQDSGIPLVTGLDRSTALTAIELLDTWAHPERTIEFVRRHRFAIGLIQEAGPHLAFYQQNCPKTEFFWTANGVDTRFFRDYGLPKKYDVIFYGVLESTIYPFRTRLAKLLKNASGLRVRYIEHPGYYPDQQPSTHPVIAGAELSREINQAWIGIATRSVYQCLLMKYLEIAASHTVVAGNLPDWGRPLFDGCFIDLREDQSDQAILATLQTHLTDKNRLQAQAAEVHRRVVSEYSTDAYAERVLGVFREALTRRSSMRRLP